MMHARLRSVTEGLVVRRVLMGLAGMVVGATLAAVLSPVALASPVRTAGAATVAHPYRHGLVPMMGTATLSPCGSGCVRYGGAVKGVGVTTGKEKVYLVFWGSQWGTASSSGPFVTYSGDKDGMAVILQKFFTGLGTGAEQWSGTMTQYCQG